MRLIDAVGFGFGGEIVEGNMDLKEMIKVAAEMRRKHSFMLDILDCIDLWLCVWILLRRE